MRFPGFNKVDIAVFNQAMEAVIRHMIRHETRLASTAHYSVASGRLHNGAVAAMPNRRARCAASFQQS